MSRYTSATPDDRAEMLAAIGVESVKAVSDVIAPLSGEIVQVNEQLADDPQKINEDPYGEGWLVKVRTADEAERGGLLDAAAYRAILGG